MTDSETSVEVMLDIFSGRPNPKWTLSEVRLEELRERLGKFPSAERKTPPKLGYRGMVISNVARIAGIPDRMNAYNGVLAITEGGETRYYQDVNGIEDWLITQAGEEGYGEAIAQFRKGDGGVKK